MVVRIDGEPVVEPRDFTMAILDIPVGRTIELVVWSDGRTRSVRVTTRELPAPDVERPPPPAARWPSPGLALRTLTPEIAARLGLPPRTSGVLVGAVGPGGPGGENGLHPGDVLIEIDRHPVVTAEEATRQLRRERRGGHLVRVMRSDGPQSVAIPDPS